ncbi:MAG: hypothetical protein JXB49_01520 [Bacteroidales bacterium]|nr:hypothetical protein [Bacteroidales bacterium]
MIGAFKYNGIDKEKLKSLVEKLRSAGLNAENVWKIGRREVEESHGGINFAEIRLDNQWIVRQNIKNGSVKFDHLPENEKLVLLRELKALDFYTTPNWGLGFGLFVLYTIIISLVGYYKADGALFVPVLVCMGLTILGTFMFYLRANDYIGNGLHVFSWIFLMAGFIATTPSCLLTLPMLVAINRYRLYTNVMKYE